MSAQCYIHPKPLFPGYNDWSGLMWYRRANQISSLGTKHCDTGVQSTLQDTREKHSELWHDCVFLPHGWGEDQKTMKEVQR